MLAYRDDGNYVKVADVSIGDTRQSEFGKQVSPVPDGYPTYGNSVGGPVGGWTWLRIVRQGSRYTQYTSIDGTHWDHAATWTHTLGRNARIGLVSMGGAGFTTTFDYVHVYRLAEPAR